jgi:16S rRNA (cytosine1402-N4)-methyltransferase
MSMKDYHVPVMLSECIEGLNIKSDGIYVDATFGGGGHSREVIKKLTAGRLFGVDQDEEARKNAEKLDTGKFTFIDSNFRYLKRFLRMEGVEKLDGLLADLGVSSHQIDVPERGFSTRYDAMLDMRMNRSQDLTAEKIINTYPGRDLQLVLGNYGEIRNARTLADNIIRARIEAPVRTTGELVNILQKFVPANKRNKYYAQVFQALRIEVNDELGALKDLLNQSADLLKSGGRLVIMAYHSLEDRLIKNFINTGSFEGREVKDFYGNSLKPFRAITRKPVMASDDEVRKNNRARSARLRIAEKI